jgi:hypothetical protein
MLDTVVTDLRTEDAGAIEAPAVSRTRLKGIAILGSHPATVEAAPFADEGWLVYACSPHNVEKRKLPRVTEWFEVHDVIEDPTRAFGYLKAISEMPFVWMRDQRALKSGYFPGARQYPEEELKGTSTIQTLKAPRPDGSVEIRQVEVPNSDGLFCPYMFTSSIAYMLAKAIVDCEQKGIKQIGIWGVMQASETEYTYQRPGIQYFLHQAAKHYGIKVLANRESCLFDMPTWKW